MAKTREALWAEKATLDERRATLAGLRTVAGRIAAEGDSILAAKLTKAIKVEAASIERARRRLITSVRRELRRRFHARFDLAPDERAAVLRCRHGAEYRQLWIRLQHASAAKPMPTIRPAVLAVAGNGGCERRAWREPPRPPIPTPF